MATIKDKAVRDCHLTRGTQETKSMAFNKIKVGKKTLSDDVTLDINQVIKASYSSRRPMTKEDVLKAIQSNNIAEQRRISDIFFKTSGIYSRLCRYMAFLYRYDWFVTPMMYDDKLKEESPQRVIDSWLKATRFLENCNLKKEFGEIALKVVRKGAYYGIMVQKKDSCFIQELPVNYCRSRYSLNGDCAVEFNLKYFNDAFPTLRIE